MLGLNDQGQMVEIKDIDPLTGARSLESINNASPTTNVMIANEVALAKDQQAAAYAEGLQATTEQVNAAKQQRVINRKERELQEYNRGIFKFQHAAQMKENIMRSRDQVSLHRAVLDFKNRPSDVSQVSDPGFRTVSPRGRAHMAPVTDYEKVLQSEDFGVTPVVIDKNPLGSVDFNQGQIINADECASHLGRMYGKSLRTVADETSIRNSDDHKNDQMGFDINIDWEALQETASDALQTEAEKYLQTQAQQLINPTKAPAPLPVAPRLPASVAPPGMLFPLTVMSAQNQKLLKYGAIGLGGVAALLLIIKAVKK